jgi:hypothetical protein
MAAVLITANSAGGARLGALDAVVNQAGFALPGPGEGGTPSSDGVGPMVPCATAPTVAVP